MTTKPSSNLVGNLAGTGSGLLVLCLFQLLGTVAAAIAALSEIETIIASGPLLGLLGVVVAVISFRMQIRWGVALGISVPVFGLICFTLIYLDVWSAQDASKAQQPFSLLVVGYAVVCLVLALGAIFELRQKRNVRLGSLCKDKFPVSVSSILGTVGCCTLLAVLLVPFFHVSPSALVLGGLWDPGVPRKADLLDQWELPPESNEIGDMTMPTEMRILDDVLRAEANPLPEGGPPNTPVASESMNFFQAMKIIALRYHDDVGLSAGASLRSGPSSGTSDFIMPLAVVVQIVVATGLIMSVASATLLLLHRNRWLWLTGLGALAVFTWGIVRAELLIWQHNQSQKTLNGFMASLDISDLFGQVRLSWGWFVVYAAAAFLLTAALFGTLRTRNQQSDTKGLETAR